MKQDTGDDSAALALEVANVEGVFLLLIIGVAAAVLCNLCEMLLAVRSRSVENQVGTNEKTKVLFRCNYPFITIICDMFVILACALPPTN